MTAKQIQEIEPIEPISRASLLSVCGGLPNGEARLLTSAERSQQRQARQARRDESANQMVGLAQRVQIGTVDPRKISRQDVSGDGVKIGGQYYPGSHLYAAQWG